MSTLICWWLAYWCFDPLQKTQSIIASVFKSHFIVLVTMPSEVISGKSMQRELADSIIRMVPLDEIRILLACGAKVSIVCLSRGLLCHFDPELTMVYQAHLSHTQNQCSLTVLLMCSLESISETPSYSTVEDKDLTQLSQSLVTGYSLLSNSFIMITTY